MDWLLLRIRVARGEQRAAAGSVPDKFTVWVLGIDCRYRRVLLLLSRMILVYC